MMKDQQKRRDGKESLQEGMMKGEIKCKRREEEKKEIKLNHFSLEVIYCLRVLMM